MSTSMLLIALGVFAQPTAPSSRMIVTSGGARAASGAVALDEFGRVAIRNCGRTAPRGPSG